jgi:hypothetical protein
MARREVKAVRGVFERPKGSGLWWINFYQDGKQHREKVGRGLPPSTSTVSARLMQDAVSSCPICETAR